MAENCSAACFSMNLEVLKFALGIFIHPIIVVWDDMVLKNISTDTKIQSQKVLKIL